MSLIFAVRWEPAGDHAFIDYMAVNDENFEYEIKPVRLEINTEDSINFHNTIQKIISDFKIKKHSQRLRDDLKGSANDKFKKTLFNYKLTSQKNGKAWQHRLWAVALHVTKGTVDKAIRKILKCIS